MEFNRRFLLILLLVLGLGAGTGYLLFGPSEAPPPAPEDSVSGGQTISNFSLTENRAEDELWRLRAENARRSDGVVHLRLPRVRFQVRGETLATLTAKEGTYRLSDQLLEVRKDVVLKRIKKNQVLKTSVLKWNRDTGMLVTDARVELSMTQGTLTATGMEAQLRKEIIRFLSDVEFSSH